MKTDFFIDTADTTTIKRIWDKLSNHCDAESCVGITTNPNALAKVNCHTLSGLSTLVKDMCNTLEDIRGAGGLVYVQVPNSCMNVEKIVEWATLLSQLDTGRSKVALKIPHFSYALRATTHPIMKNLTVNVTGISDCGTTIKALNYDNVCYASIIPGRMEEVGIDANAHLKYLCDNNFRPHQKIITGSMRTLQGLKSAIFYKTVPTIGTRVWDVVDSENRWEEFSSYWDNTYNTSITPIEDYCPLTTEININLSKQFFEQMDSLGMKMYNEFIGE